VYEQERLFDMSNDNQNPVNDASAPSIDVSGLEPADVFACQECGNSLSAAGARPLETTKCPSCGAAATVPAKFGHFLLLKRLGAGGMGTVYLAQDMTLGRKVAIKMMQKSLAEDATAFETFRNEAQSAAKLNHPHVAQVYSFGQKHGNPYLEMELVPGNSLDKFISDDITLDPAFVMRVGLEVAEGLRAAEGVGLFHGDIKPDNILFDANMHGKLVDFGIASLASQGNSNELWGTPYYIAPEKVQKKKNSARSDIYSLGATLYHAIAGEPPYEGDDAVSVIKARFAGPPKPLNEIRPEIEPEVMRIISRMMYNDLFMRYPNYGSLINDIKNYLSAIPAVRKQGPMKTQSLATRALGTGRLPSAGSTSGEFASANKTGKRFVIQKGAMEAQAAFSAAQPTRGGVRVVERAEPTLKPEDTERKTSGLKIAVFTVGVLVLLGILAAVGFVGRLVYKQQQTKKTTASQIQEASVVEGAVYGLLDEIGAAANRMAIRDGEMTNLLASLNAVFLRATDEPLMIPNLEPQPALDSDTDGAALVEEEKPVEEASTVEPPKDASPSDAAALPPLDPEFELLARIELKKVGVESPNREMLELMIKKLKKDSDKAAVVPESAPEPEPAREPTPEPELAPEPVAEVEPEPEAVDPIRVAAIRMQTSADQMVFEHARSIRKDLRRCQEIVNEAPEVFGEIKPDMTPVAIDAALTRRVAARERHQAHVAEMNRLVDAADGSLRAIKRAIVQIEQEAQKLIAERDRLAREQAQEERLAREAAVKAAQESQVENLINEETQRIEEVLQSKKELIDAFDYERVILEMNRMEGELTRPESKAVLKWTILRFERLISLRKFLVKDLQNNGILRRAYRNNDIRGVSEDGTQLLLSMRPATNISSLTVADWLQLITYQLERRARDRPIGLVEWGEQLFNAAIFCYVHGDGNEAAWVKARQLAALGLEKRTSLKLDAVKLLPILETDSSDEATEGF